MRRGLFKDFLDSTTLASRPLLSRPLPLEVGPLKYSQVVWGSAVSSQRGLGRSPDEFWTLVHFILKIRHLCNSFNDFLANQLTKCYFGLHIFRFGLHISVGLHA